MCERQTFKVGLKYCVDRGRGCYCHGRDGYLCNSSSGEAGIILSGLVSHLASNFRAFKTAAHIASKYVRKVYSRCLDSLLLILRIEDVYSIADKVRILRRSDD